MPISGAEGQWSQVRQGRRIMKTLLASVVLYRSSIANVMLHARPNWPEALGEECGLHTA